MKLEKQFEQQARILELVSASKLTARKKRATEQTLNTQRVHKLLSTQPNLDSVKRKLQGKRNVRLNKKQQSIVTLVNNLLEFEHCVGSWIESYTKNNVPYAVEYVLQHFDVRKGDFVRRGSGNDLVRRLSFADIKSLTRYCCYADDLESIYAQPKKRGKINYKAQVEKVAKLLIGRKMVFPNEPLDTAVAINAWEKFLKKKDNEYEPLEARVLETEGFETEEDVARTRYCMLAAPGQIDVMPYRGRELLNIGTHRMGKPSCVMIRTVEVDGKCIEGPGRVGAFLNCDYLIGKLLETDIPIKGITSSCGVVPGTAEYSVGRFRLQ